MQRRYENDFIFRPNNIFNSVLKMIAYMYIVGDKFNII